VIFSSNPGIYFHTITGFFLILLGEFIRINSVRYAGGKTRSKYLKASKLCTNGPYSLVRNPIYIGNIIIYSGAVLLSNNDFQLITLFFIVIFFLVKYKLIISLEEEYLEKKFFNEYFKYKQKVPKLIPKFLKWDINKKIKKKNWIQSLKIEKRTFQALGLFILFLFLKSTYFIK